jgi:hypothetical protein
MPDSTYTFIIGDASTNTTASASTSGRFRTLTATEFWEGAEWIRREEHEREARNFTVFDPAFNPLTMDCGHAEKYRLPEGGCRRCQENNK